MTGTLPRLSQALGAAAQEPTTKPAYLRLVEILPAHPEGFMSEHAYQQYLAQKAMMDANDVKPKAPSVMPPLQHQEQKKGQSYQVQQMQQQQQAGGLLLKTP